MKKFRNLCYIEYTDHMNEDSDQAETRKDAQNMAGLVHLTHLSEPRVRLECKVDFCRVSTILSCNCVYKQLSPRPDLI